MTDPKRNPAEGNGGAPDNSDVLAGRTHSTTGLVPDTCTCGFEDLRDHAETLADDEIDRLDVELDEEGYFVLLDGIIDGLRDECDGCERCADSCWEVDR